MSDLISKALLCGLGLASLTKDAIQKTAEELVSQSKLSEEEGRKLVEDLHKRSKLAQKALDKKVDEAIEKALKKFNLQVADHSPKKVISPAKGPAKKPRAKAKKMPAAE